MERVGGLSPKEKRMGEETCTQFLLRTGLGRKGLTVQVHLRRKGERMQIRLGNMGQEHYLWEFCYKE